MEDVIDKKTGHVIENSYVPIEELNQDKVSFIDYNKSISTVESNNEPTLLRSTSIEYELLQQEDIYVLVKFLGHGAFGRVNLYRNAKDNSLVVWKEINLRNSDPKSRNEAFSEVEILAMLDHPNIIAYYKHFISEDMLYIELEYAKGGTLANLIRHNKYQQKYFDEDTVLWYLFQLAGAVEYIHELGIMHRDIKALNIFIMQNGLLKLGDFGIAKVLEANDELAESVSKLPFSFHRLKIKKSLNFHDLKFQASGNTILYESRAD